LAENAETPLYQVIGIEIERGLAQRMPEKFWIGLYTLVDPPKSPLKRGTLNPVPPFLGVAALKELGG
jgi:hypothetical protein